MRGVAHIEEVQPGKGRHRRGAVMVTELPYQLSKAGWIEKMAELVNDGKIGGIADIRDESDRDGMRVVIELRATPPQQGAGGAAAAHGPAEQLRRHPADAGERPAPAAEPAPPRRTRIQTEAERAEESQQVEEIIAETVEEAAVVEFTQKGYVRRYSQKAYQRRQARLEADSNPKLHEVEDDPVIQTEPALTTQEVLTLTRDGRAFTVAVEAIPNNPRQGKGSPLVNLLPGSVPPDADAIVAQFVIREDLLEHDLILVTQKGKIKRAPLKEFTNLTGRGLTAMKVKDGDELAYVTLAELGDDLVLGTTGGRLLRFPIDDDNLQVMGRAAQGPQGIRLGKTETLAGCVRVQSGKDCVLLVSAAGYAKRLPVEGLRVAKRGDIGTQSFQFSLKTDRLVALLPAVPEEAVTLFTSADRTAVIPVDSVPRQGRTGESDRIVKPNKGETITQVIQTSPLEDGNPGKTSADDE
jgi:DNA gyrase subunit A